MKDPSRTGALVVAATMTAILTLPVEAEKPGLPRILPPDLETKLALSGAPEHLREQANVLLLGEDGYELSRRGSSEVFCLVVRGPGIGPPAWDDMIAPWCFDHASWETVGRAMVDRARYRQQGLGAEEIRARIAEGFATGSYVTPNGTGVIYMLSPINKVPDHRTGKLFDYVPHVMYLAPETANEDIGVPAEVHTGDPHYVWSGLPFVPQTGPHGFIVQPLGEKEGAAIVDDYRELIERVREYVDLDVRWEQGNDRDGQAIGTVEGEAFERYARDELAVLDAYLFDSAEREIALARSAAPDHIASRAEVLVLGRDGYVSASAGNNGFVCLVERSWAGRFDYVGSFWDPVIRAPNCYNAVGAEYVLPLYLLRTRLAMAGRTRDEIRQEVDRAVSSGELPAPVGTAMSYMMSGEQYLHPDIGRWKPHLMLWLPYTRQGDWGPNSLAGPDPVVFLNEGGPFAMVVIPFPEDRFIYP